MVAGSQQQQQQQQYTNPTNIHTSSPAIYQIQRDSSNLASVGLHGTVATAVYNSNSPNTQRYNQSIQASSGSGSNDSQNVQESQNQILNGQKIKFEPGKGQDKFEHSLLPPKHEQQQQQQQQQTNKYDPNLAKYEQQAKYEQPTVVVQSSKMYIEQQQNKLHDQGVSQIKHEQQHHNIKYEPGRDMQQYSKHEQQQQQQHEGRPTTKYDHNATLKHDPTSKYDSQYKVEYKLEQNKYEAPTSKYEQNSVAKHDRDRVDHAKFDISVKTADKPFEFVDRPKGDSERKSFNESRMEDKTKPALPPKPSKPNPPPRLTHHEKIDAPSDGINECKTTNVNLNSRFVCILLVKNFDL